MSAPSNAAKDLTQSTVLIVGGTSGVGLATAKRFAAAGVQRLALVGRSRERGQTALAEVRASNDRIGVDFIAADANDAAQACDAGAKAQATLGRIDILVNSTISGFLPRLLHDMPLEDVGRTLVQQALAPLHMCRVVLPGMRAQRSGVIVNIASDAAKLATPGESVLGAAMAAIVMFTRTLAIEAKRDGIRVNAVTPSLIASTPGYDQVMQDPFSARLFGSALKQAHLGVTEPQDLADLIVFLASPAAGKITGQAISVNGGISAA